MNQVLDNLSMNVLQIANERYKMYLKYNLLVMI